MGSNPALSARPFSVPWFSRGSLTVVRVAATVAVGPCPRASLGRAPRLDDRRSLRERLPLARHHERGLHGNRPNSGTSVHAIATCIYRGNKRIVTPDGPGAFNLNQYLIAGDNPLLFHAGPRRMLPRASEAVAKILPMDRLRDVGFSHIEADESGPPERRDGAALLRALARSLIGRGRTM